MTKKLLLVDDDKAFLDSLKAGLDPHAEIFETHLCYSVNEAIKHIFSRDYDLIVTDLRLPEKTGLDLLIFLKKIKYTGRLMVMSAYNTVDNIKRIRSLGNIDIFSKPFNLEWFTRKLIEIFSSEEEVLFESIDLMTVMQVINLERKTSAIQVDNDGDKGFIYFEDGEIIRADYMRLRDEAAIRELLNLEGGSISIKKTKSKVKKTLRRPFVELIMELTTKIDETRKIHEETVGEVEASANGEKNPQEGENTGEEQDGKAIDDAIKETLTALREITGFLGAGIFDPEGESLGQVCDESWIDFELVGAEANQLLSDAEEMAQNAGFGETIMLQIDTQFGLMFCHCHHSKQAHFHTVMILKSNGNIALARLKLVKTLQALAGEISR